MSSGAYSSPSDARARRRRADSGTVYRDRRRKPEERAAAALGRKLAELAEEFPRFRSDLNRLRHRVLVQMRSEGRKLQAVLASLSDDPMTIEELVEETDLDRQSIEQALLALAAKGEAAKCNRNGGAVPIRSDEKPAVGAVSRDREGKFERIYWRKNV